MGEAISVPKEEYDELVKKANLFERYIETEELTKNELEQIKEALKGPFMAKSEFLKKHPELA